MPEHLEGSKAVATAIARCRPQVVCAYPITPQTHIVEAIGKFVRTGRLPGCQFINVESEFAAMSVAIGASAAGSRSYTATASQGLLYMTEAVYNAAGLGLPIVMTVANRAVGAPINIWNDHSDAMALRDSGWIQLYARDNQEAVDFHLVAFRLAEAVSVPVMVCVDGFVLTHASEAVELPDQGAVDAFLPRFAPRQRLDPSEPLTIGAMVGPESFTEVKYLADVSFRSALSNLPGIMADFDAVFGRRYDPFVQSYGPCDARTVVVCQGSVAGTLETVTDELNQRGGSFRILAISLFRPFPYEEVRRALRGAMRIIVIERALCPGGLGFVTAEVGPLAPPSCRVDTVVAGLGGRPIGRASLVGLLGTAATGSPSIRFLDLDTASVGLERTPGP